MKPDLLVVFLLGIFAGSVLCRLWRNQQQARRPQVPPRQSPPSPVPPEWSTPGAHGFTPPPPAPPRPHDSQEMRWLGELSKVKVALEAWWRERMGSAKVLIVHGGFKLGVVQQAAVAGASKTCATQRP